MKLALSLLVSSILMLSLAQDSFALKKKRRHRLITGAMMACEEAYVANRIRGEMSGDVIEMPEPVYPPEARAEKLGGVVAVSVSIDESGKVVSASAIYGPSSFYQAAMDAAYRARFKIIELSGVPVKSVGTLFYSFNLREALPPPDSSEEPPKMSSPPLLN